MNRLSRAAFVALSALAGFGFYRAVRDGLWWILVLAIRCGGDPVAGSAAGGQGRCEEVTVGLAALGGYIEGLISKSDEVSKAVAKTIGGAVGVV